MTDIIARLEALTEPSREVDEVIFGLHHGRTRHRSTFEQYEPSERLPTYTASLDAAMSLVPDGMEFNMTNIYGIVRVEMGLNTSDGEIVTSERKDCNWAIALCIAALKARGIK